jgi:hypothetical protein
MDWSLSSGTPTPLLRNSKIVEQCRELISLLKTSESNFPRIVHVKLIKLVTYVKNFV